MADLTSRLILSLIDRVTGPARNVQQAISRVQDRVEQNSQALTAARGDLFGAAAGFAAFAAALAAPVSAASDFESAMADVIKVVDFESPQALADFRQDLFDLSQQVPVTVQGLTEIAAAAGQAGIAGADLVRFTEAAAKISTAFDITADDAGSSLAAIMAATGGTLDETILLTDAMNHLSNAQNSAAADILDVQRRVGSQGKQFGFAAEEVAAFASAMLSTGNPSEVVATSFANMGRALTRGASATKRQREAYEALGLEATDVAERMQEDAVGTTLAVIDALGKMPAAQRAALSSDLFGDEARALAPLLVNTDLLRQSLGLIAEQADYAGSSFQEFEVRNRTFGARMQKFRNSLNILAITIGTALLPGLTDLMDSVAPIISALIEWSSQNGDLVASIVRVTGALLGLRVAFYALKVIGLTGRGGYLWLLAQGLGTIGRAASSVRASIGGVYALQSALAAMSGVPMTRLDAVRAGLVGIARVTGLSAAASALASVGAAIATISAPVWIAIAAAVAAVAAAGYALWRYWDRITAIFRGVKAAIVEALQPALDAIGPALSAVIPFVQPVIDAFNGLRVIFDAVAGWVRDAFGAIWDFLSSLSFEQEVLSDADVASIEGRAKELTARVIDAVAGLPYQLFLQGQEALQSLWRAVDAGAGVVLARVGALVSDLVAAITALGQQLFDAGAAAFQSLLDGITSKGEAILEYVRGIGDKIAETLSISRGGNSREETRAAEESLGLEPDVTRAAGGHLWPGQSVLTGERGPERIWASQRAFVSTMEQTRRLAELSRRVSAPRPLALSTPPAASTGSRLGSSGPVPVSQSFSFGDIVIHQPGASAQEIGRELGRQVGVLMRSSVGEAY